MKKIAGLFRNKKALLALFILIIAIVAGTGLFLYQKNKTEKNPSSIADVKDLTSSVGKLIDLPAGEDPTIATVSDITKLRDQAFFTKALNGDKVLIYQKAKKAILYRPSENKIIEVAVYNPQSPPQTIPSPSVAAQETKVALFNGTTIVGYTKTVQADLEKKVANIEITVRENAARADYEKTIVVDFENNSKVASDIAKALDGEVGNLPEGEIKPEDSDILVILGTN